MTALVLGLGGGARADASPDITCFVAATTGLPAMAFPVGLDERGMPVGLELLGQPYDDEALVAMTAAFEAARGPLPPASRIPGRADLAAQFRRKYTARLVLYWGGVAISGVGLIVMFASVGSEGTSGLWIGMGLTFGGLLPMLASLFINPHPVEPAEARRLADEHNQRLRERLGLPPQTAALRMPQTTKARLSWSPFASATAGGLTLRLEM